MHVASKSLISKQLFWIQLTEGDPLDVLHALQKLSYVLRGDLLDFADE